jgi:hypothetical protein
MRSNWDYYAIKRIRGKVKTHTLHSKSGIPCLALDDVNDLDAGRLTSLAHSCPVFPKLESARQLQRLATALNYHTRLRR